MASRPPIAKALFISIRFSANSQTMCTVFGEATICNGKYKGLAIHAQKQYTFESCITQGILKTVHFWKLYCFTQGGTKTTLSHTLQAFVTKNSPGLRPWACQMMDYSSITLNSSTHQPSAHGPITLAISSIALESSAHQLINPKLMNPSPQRSAL